MAFTIKRNSKVGRYAVAAQDLTAGEQVLTETSFVVGPKSGTKPLCLGCYCPVDCSTVCTECGWPVCGVSCEERSLHRQGECGVFSAAKVRYQPETGEKLTNGSPQYECITPLRMLLNKERDPDHWEAEIKGLEAHSEQRKTTSCWARQHTQVVSFLRQTCCLSHRFSEDIIHWVMGVLEVNGFELRTADGYFVRGLYPQTAMMSHNCVANTTHSVYPMDNFRSFLRTTVAVPKGGELYVSYTSSIQPTIFRRENIRANKYFDCDCKRCSDPTELDTHLSTLICTKCKDGLVMSSQPLDQEAVWKCSKCGFCISPNMVRRIFLQVQNEVEKLDSIEGTDVKLEMAESLMTKLKGRLHPRQVYLTSLRHTLIQLYGRAPGYTFDDLSPDMLLRKIDLCRQVLQVVDIVKPGMNRFRGMILYELHVPLMLLNQNKLQRRAIKKEEFKKKMMEVADVLKEAVTILCLEDPSSLEGAVGQVAKQSLSQLTHSIRQLQ